MIRRRNGLGRWGEVLFGRVPPRRMQRQTDGWIVVAAHVELWKPTGVEMIILDKDQFTIGRNPANDIALSQDKMVSAQHAILQSMTTGWFVQDLGSRNGTFVGGERVLATRALRHGDDVVVGRTKLVFRDTVTDLTRTHGALAPPELTRRERDVLRALCRPLFSGQIVREPASLRAIANELTVTEAAVQQHLGRLYDKFAVPAAGHGRRAVLANEAIGRGAITHADMTDLAP